MPRSTMLLMLACRWAPEEPAAGCAPQDEVPYDGIDQDCDGADLTDADGDGRDAAEAGGVDCDDAHATVHPDAEETPYDGRDQDCDGVDLTDVDGDGQDAESAGGTDCGDGDPTVYAGGTEVDGYVDEDWIRTSTFADPEFETGEAGSWTPSATGPAADAGAFSGDDGDWWREVPWEMP